MAHQGIGRRQLLRVSGALALTGLLPPLPGPRRARAGDLPLFSLGVASGDPTRSTVVLWTRLAPDPLGEGGVPAKRVEVDWEVFADEGLTRRAQRGRAIAKRADGHAVHVTVRGLDPDRWYWYRFRALGEESRVGRTRTMPAPGQPAARLRLALCSCQDYQNGYWAAYRDLAEQDVDLVLHVGDYIYEYAALGGAVRQHVGGETQTLADYRVRHALYKLDPMLQEAHARFPFVVTWDDHEVQDNYAGPISEHGVPRDEFLRRRAAAYQAYFEHMPLRRDVLGPRQMTLYRQLDFGALARIAVLDGRQFRTDQPCDPPPLGIVGECPDVFSQNGTMLGGRQEAWLYRTLGRSRATWNVVAQQTMMLRGDLGEALGSMSPIYNVDAWDGYQAQRRRIVDYFARGRLANPIVLTGDIHSAWVADLKEDFLRQESATVATELVGTSISTDFPAGFIPLIEPNIGPNTRNPHIKYFEGRHRGYLLCDVTPAEWRADFRAVDDVKDASSAVGTAASWIVRAGTPGGVRA